MANNFLAYHMPAIQSGTCNGQVAGFAVDNQTGAPAFAFNDPGGSPAWWQVDLTVPCIVYSVTVIALLDSSE